jgi:2',3'-cyclic-nucleotide 2'-phosphodiesterase (5'-nucleotidase family)
MITITGLGLVETAAASRSIRAEKVAFSRIAPGDRFVIVCEPDSVSISLNPSKNRLAPADVTLAHTESRQVLTALSENTAIFEIEPTDGNDLLLRCQNGYLTCTDTGKGLCYTDAPNLYSLWRVIDDVYLYNPNAIRTTSGTEFSDVYLEFYPGGPHFGPYGMDDGIDTASFTLAFYRLGNSAPQETVQEDAHYTLPVFDTSDVHGYMANVTEDSPQYLLAYISDKVKDVRGYGNNARKDLAILLDGGDIYQGNPLSSVLDGESLSAAFDLMGYDAVTIGNHEFEWQLDHTVDGDGTMMDYSFRDYVAQNVIPVVACNLYQNGEKVPFAEDYVILKKTARNGDGHELPVKIGVIGMVGDYGDSIRRSEFSRRGYSIDLDFGYVNAIARELETSGQCDATILLVHERTSRIVSGLGVDTAIDLVLGGHVHHVENWVTPQGLRYMEPSCNGKAYAYAELAFDSVAGSPVFQGVKNARVYLTGADPSKLENTPGNSEELDASLVQLTDTVIDAASDILYSEVGTISQSVLRYESLPGSGNRACTCGNWVASIFARAMQADVGFINSGGLRADFKVDSQEGNRKIVLSDLYTMFPFENGVCCFELTWEELLIALEYAMTPGGNILLSNMVGVDCYYTEAGINAIVTSRGEAIYVNGIWKEGWSERKVRVAVNDYIATTNRNRGQDMSNPFVQWSDTDRLVTNGETDIECAIRVLSQEAAANNGNITIDTIPHFINGVYQPADS